MEGEAALSASFPFYLQMARRPGNYGQNTPESKEDVPGRREGFVLHMCVWCDGRCERLALTDNEQEDEDKEECEEE